DTPHLPHAWECGFLMEERTKTLLCGDLFTQGGADHPPITESDILGPSEAFRQTMDYYSHTKNGREMLERLAATEPSPSHACTAAHGAATGRASCGLSPMKFRANCTPNSQEGVRKSAGIC